MHQFARRDRAGQNRDEVAIPTKPLPATTSFGTQSLRQNAYFAGPNTAECVPSSKMHQIQQPRMMREQTIRSEQHDEQLKQLHPAHDRRFIVFIRQLPRKSLDSNKMAK